MKRKTTIRHGIDTLRAQPLEARRQTLVFLSFFCTFIVVLFWVLTLKSRFAEEAEITARKNATSLIKENVTKVYSSSPQEN